MPETVAVDGPSVVKEGRQRVGIVQRQGDGFPLDQSRVAYLRYLRRERRQSPRTEADAEHVAVKTEMLRLKLMERKHELVRRGRERAARPTRRCTTDAPERHGGAVLARSHGAAQDRLVFEIGCEISEACTVMADAVGEPPLEQQV